MVMRVDKEKGYIDLSKRRVAREDVAACEDKYTKGKTIHSIMRTVSEKCGMSIEECFQKIAWPLDKNPKYKSAYNAFQLSVGDPEILDKNLDIPENAKTELLKEIKQKMTPQPIRIRADIDVTCFAEAGINAVRESLLAGETASTDDIPVKIQLIAPPLYVLLATSTNKQKGLEVVQNAIDKITEKINDLGGKLVVQKPPRATSKQEESELLQKFEELENENQDEVEDE